MSSRSKGATMANSTIDCERCLRVNLLFGIGRSEATNDHVRVDRHMHGVTQNALHEAGRKSEAHDDDHVDVLTSEAVVGWSSGQIDAWRALVADVEQWLGGASRRVSVIRVGRVVKRIAVGRGGTCRARKGL